MRQERQRTAAGKNQAKPRESRGRDTKSTCRLRRSVSRAVLLRGCARLQVNPEVRAFLRLHSGHHIAGQGPCRWTDRHAGVLPLTRAVQLPVSSARSPRALGSRRAIGRQPQTRLRSRSLGCAPRGAPRRHRAGSGAGGSARGTHPQTAAGSTAARTAASCSPASARQKQRRRLPKQRAGRSRPRRRQGRGAISTGQPRPPRLSAAVPARKVPMPFMKAWAWHAAYCCSACGDSVSAGTPAPSAPLPPASLPRTHRVFGGHAVLHPPQPEVHHHGAGSSRSSAPSGTAMAEPSGPFGVLRDGADRYLCYCRPASGPGSAATV